MRRPTMIIIACIGFIFGIILGYAFVFQPDIYWALFAIFALPSAFLLSRKTKIIPIGAFMIIAGIAVITARTNYIASHGITDRLFQKVTVEGNVTGDPYWDKESNYVFILTDLKESMIIFETKN